MAVNINWENKIFEKGCNVIAGIDEVGRGSLSGPVVSGCVVFSREGLSLAKPQKGIVINDSKKLTPRQRIISDKWIRDNCTSYGIGMSSVYEINRKGITKAVFSSFRRSISNAEGKLKLRVEYLLIDAFYTPYIKGYRMPRKSIRKSIPLDSNQISTIASGNQTAIVKGDERSFTIACASIIAKVYRDKLMQKLAENRKYKNYGWHSNKGYGTKEHINAIKQFGVTNLHRKQFVRKIMNQ